jgi:hypothetical protein
MDSKGSWETPDYIVTRATVILQVGLEQPYGL